MSRRERRRREANSTSSATEQCQGVISQLSRVPKHGRVMADLERIRNLNPWEAYRRARRALRLGDMARHTACFYLAELADGGFQRLGHPTMEHCLKHRFPEHRSTLWNYVKVGRALLELPLIDAAWAAGKLSYSAVFQLLKVVVAETQEAWIAWATGRPLEEVKSHTRGRELGARPTDPHRRTIGPVTVRVSLHMTPTQHELYRHALDKLKAEYGAGVSDSKLVSLLAAAVLESCPDGSLPGRKQVKDRFYVLHAQPAGAGGQGYVARDENGELVPLDLQELAELDGMLKRLPQAALVAVSEARRSEIDLAVLDPRNCGPLVPEAERDVPTPEAMRGEVMARDGFRCRSCGALSDLTIHHVHMRSYGGRTEPGNLITLCAVCHGSVHAFALVIVGDANGEVQFVDRQGQLRDRPRVETDGELEIEGEAAVLDLDAADEPTAAPGEAPLLPAARMEQVELATIPEEVDGEWWERHRELLSWNERLGQLELRPGYVPAAAPAAAPAVEVALAATTLPAPQEVRASQEVIASQEPPARQEESASQEASEPAAKGRLAGLVGQDAVRERLMTEVAAARLTGRALPHLLFAGEPGLGKTHLAEAVAVELGAPLVRLPAALVRGPETLLGALAGIAPRTVVFLDEVHGIPRKPAEFLYEAMDGGVLSLPIRQGLAQRTIRLRLPAFTLIGGTTDEDELPRAFLSRLDVLRLVPYAQAELEQIVVAAAASEGLTLTSEASALLAGAGRDTPRAALQLLRSLSSQAVVAGVRQVDRELVEQVFARDGVDPDGRTGLDRAYLGLIADGQALGVRTIAAKLGASERTVREVVEPFLLRRGWITVTCRGRARAA